MAQRASDSARNTTNGIALYTHLGRTKKQVHKEHKTAEFQGAQGTSVAPLARYILEFQTKHLTLVPVPRPWHHFIDGLA